MQNWPELLTTLSSDQPEPVMLWIGFGSYFHQPYRQHSDIDLLGITRTDSRAKSIRQLGGESYEMSLVGLPSFRQMLADRHPVYVPLLMHGRFLAGDQALFSALRQQAEPVYQAGPLNIEHPVLLAGLRNRLRTIWQDLLDLREQPALFTLCLAEWSEQLISYYCGRQKIWRRGRKYALLDLALASPAAAATLQQVLDSTDNVKRLVQIKQLMQQVLTDASSSLQAEDLRIAKTDTLKAGALSL